MVIDAMDRWRESDRVDYRALRALRELDWNHCAPRVPDPLERPSQLSEHLDWFAAAGFVGVLVVWMFAGHAGFGGRRPA